MTYRIPGTPAGEWKDPPETENTVVEKWCYFQELIKLHRSWNIGEKMGKKINFELRSSYVNFKMFSKISNLNWFFAQTHKILPLGFLISFRIMNDFQ